MTTTLFNSQISATIKSLGAELCSLSNTAKTEYIWQANPSFWGKHAPVLFPIVGTLKNNIFKYKNQDYSLLRHGFARDMEFELIEKSTNRATFSLQATDATLKKYPFEFELQIQYTLIDSTLEVVYRVYNRSETLLPFSIGAHPAFSLPNPFTDYTIAFEKTEPLEYTLLENDLISKQTEQIKTNTNLVPLDYELFKRDALIFKKLQSNSLTILDKDHPILKVHFEDFPNLGIWTKTDAPFICIEPWFGYSDTTESTANLFDKEDSVILNSNGVFKAKYSIEIL